MKLCIITQKGTHQGVDFSRYPKNASDLFVFYLLWIHHRHGGRGCDEWKQGRWVARVDDVTDLSEVGSGVLFV